MSARPGTRRTRIAAKIASVERHNGSDPQLVELRRALALERVEDRVRAALEEAPPLPAAVEERCLGYIRAAARRPDEAAVA